MIIWLIYFIISLVVSLICYVTNPIVLLFCDEDGELPSVLHYWQTWDNSCDASDIKHIAPSWLLYDWDAHYHEFKDTTEYLHSVNRERWYTTCYNYNFTHIERIKRYFCRLLWLTRNNAYGWCFYLLGLNVAPTLKISRSENTLFACEDYENGLFGAWMYKNDAPIGTLFGWQIRWNNLIGWKIDTTAKYDTRAMIANRIAFRIEREE